MPDTGHIATALGQRPGQPAGHPMVRDLMSGPTGR
jgi:hypothetical protein